MYRSQSCKIVLKQNCVVLWNCDSIQKPNCIVLWNCDFLIFNFGNLSRTRILQWMDSKKIMNEIILLDSKFWTALYGQYFLKKVQNWPNSRSESGIFDRFHNFSQFVKLWRSLKLDCVVLWLWCLLKKTNCVVLWKCEFSQSQLHNFILQLWCDIDYL